MGNTTLRYRQAVAVAPPCTDLLTTEETARALGCSHRTILAHITAGLLPSLRTLGGHHRIPRDEVAAAALDMGLTWAKAELVAPFLSGGDAA